MLEFKHALRICVWELTVNKLVNIIFEPDQRYLGLEIAGYPYIAKAGHIWEMAWPHKAKTIFNCRYDGVRNPTSFA